MPSRADAYFSTEPGLQASPAQPISGVSRIFQVYYLIDPRQQTDVNFLDN